MKYQIKKEDKLYELNQQELEQQLKKINLLYQLSDDCLLIPIIIEDQSLQPYLNKRLLKIIPNLNICNGKNITLKELNDSIKNKPTYFYNLDSFCKNILTKELLFSSINMSRDNLFLKNKSIFIFSLTEDDYIKFHLIADDFSSYCTFPININNCYINNSNKNNLSSYLQNKNKIKKL